MRSVGINFQVDGMRPNTLVHAFFDEVDVTNSCSIETGSIIEAREGIEANANIQTMVELANAQIDTFRTTGAVVLKTDETGSISGSFYYDKDQRKLETGKKKFRLTNSSTNDKSTEITFAEATFFSDGIIREIYKEVLRPPDPVPEDNGYGGSDSGAGFVHFPRLGQTVAYNDMKYLNFSFLTLLSQNRVKELEIAVAEIAEGFMANGLSEPPYENIGEPSRMVRKSGLFGFFGHHRRTEDTRFRTLLSVVVWKVKEYKVSGSGIGAFGLLNAGRQKVRADGVARLISATMEAIRSNKTSGFGP